MVKRYTGWKCNRQVHACQRVLRFYFLFSGMGALEAAEQKLVPFDRSSEKIAVMSQFRKRDLYEWCKIPARDLRTIQSGGYPFGWCAIRQRWANSWLRSW